MSSILSKYDLKTVNSKMKCPVCGKNEMVFYTIQDAINEGLPETTHFDHYHCLNCHSYAHDNRCRFFLDCGRWVQHDTGKVFPVFGLIKNPKKIGGYAVIQT